MKYDLIIVGGGIGGSALAAVMAKAGGSGPSRSAPDDKVIGSGFFITVPGLRYLLTGCGAA